MANAKRCDICGNYYEIYNTKNSPKKVNGFVYVNETEDRGYYAHGIQNCCPECMTAVKTFVEELKDFDKEAAKAKALMSIHAMDRVSNAYKKLLFMDRRATKDEMWAVIEEAIGYLGEALDDEPAEAEEAETKEGTAES